MAQMKEVMDQDILLNSLEKITLFLKIEDVPKLIPGGGDREKSWVVVTQIASSSFVYTGKFYYEFSDAWHLVQKKFVGQPFQEHLCIEMMKEFSNIFIGNIKNILVFNGMTGALSLPLTMPGELDVVFPRPSLLTHRYQCQIPLETVSFLFFHELLVFDDQIISALESVKFPPNEDDSTEFL
jgi:hypothetical protein